MTIEEQAKELGVKLIGRNRGGLSLHSETLHVCAVCQHQTEKTFIASSDTHHILNRSLEPVAGIGLCVACWGGLVKEWEDR